MSARKPGRKQRTVRADGFLKCNACEQWKEPEEFHVYRQAICGRRSTCKACDRVVRQERRAARKDTAALQAEREAEMQAELRALGRQLKNSGLHWPAPATGAAHPDNTNPSDARS